MNQEFEDCIVTFEQATEQLEAIEQKLADRFNLNDLAPIAIRNELIRMDIKGELIEDELVRDWQSAYSWYLGYLQDERIEMAKDILARLETARFEAMAGEYIFLNMDEDDIPMDKCAKEFFANRDCKGCVKGGFLLAAIDRYNKLKLDDIVDDRKGVDRKRIYITGNTNAGQWLGQFFTSKQLGMMEAAFELCNDISHDTLNLSVDEGKRSIYFGNQYSSNEERLRAILENVIENNGEFKP